MLGFADARVHVPDDVGFEPVALREQPEGSLAPFIARLGRLNGPFGIRRLIRDVARFTDLACREFPGAVRAIGADAMIVDQTDPAGGLVALKLGLPYANVANALPINREPAVPPPFVPWRYDPSKAGLERNAWGYRIADWIEAPINRAIGVHAEAWGLGARSSTAGTWSPRLQITQCIAGLDFPRRELPSHFHYVGPLRALDEARLDPDLAAFADTARAAARPLVFCSLGTLQGSRARIFRAVAAAAADLDLALVIAHGGLLGAAEIARLPGRPLVRAYVPQRALLARADLAVTHAGFNTVMDALSFGVPLVALPIAFEQPATGARIAHAGAGMIVRGLRTRDRVRSAMAAVVGEQGYKRKAQVLAQEIAGAGGVRRAADLIEAIV